MLFPVWVKIVTTVVIGYIVLGTISVLVLTNSVEDFGFWKVFLLGPIVMMIMFGILAAITFAVIFIMQMWGVM